MKKLFILCLAAILLGACSGKDEQAKDTTNNDESKATQTAEPENGQRDNTEVQETEVQEEKSEGSSAVNEDQSSYTELPTVLDTIGNDQFEQVIKTDNPNKRVILFEDEHHNKKFKSILIKHDNRLKVIDLENDRMMLNEVL